MKKILSAIGIISLFFCSSQAFAQQKPISARVDSLMQLMSIEEKVGQLNQYSGREATGPVTKKQTAILEDIQTGKVGSMLNVHGVKDTRKIQEAALQSRLKIPLLFAMDVIHGYETVFPIPLAEAASWDLEAIKLSAHIAAKEAAAAGLHWTFAPMVDISQDPRWGRVMEGAGEDTYLGSEIARARVLGFQGENLGALDAVMACAKHFAGYGAVKAGRDYNVVDMSLQQLWETQLPPFKAAADAGVATFMNSFSTLNGIPATGHSYLQREILKGKWGYNGFVVSDWGSIREMVLWSYAEDLKDAALKAITAGNDMDMESEAYKRHLPKLIEEGKVDIKLLDDAVRRILHKKFELGLFEDPFRFSDPAREERVLNDPSHKEAARNVAKRSIVLLKNETDILPISKEVKTIAVIGQLGRSKRDLLGAWIPKADTTLVTSLLEGLEAKLASGSNLIYAKGSNINDDDRSGFEEAVEAAKKADVVIMALGESYDMSGEAKSKTNIHLPGVQGELFEAVQAVGKPVIVVLMAGRPIIFNKIAERAPSILYAWWLGAEAGNAIADVIFGNYNPSGKLPMSFPRSMGQIPIAYTQYNTGKPKKHPDDIKYKSAYIDSPNRPLYAFGHGLSYTTFEYSNLNLSESSMTGDETVELSFTLTNTGERAGEEVVQLYVKDHVASVVRPLKELKDFQKIALEPGESRTIKFTITKDKLSFYNKDLEWVAEPGEFTLMVGGSSDDIELESAFEYALSVPKKI